MWLALACGSTGNSGKPGPSAGSGGTAGTPAAGGTDGLAGAARGDVDAGGTESAGGSAGGAGGEAGEAQVELGERVELVRDQVPNKLDLLMMIDNSISMGDKQQLLADAMRHLVDRLIQPRCLDEQELATGEQASTAGLCPAGSHPEFLPFVDIHAAVITSSLGARGAAETRDVCVSPDDDDHARLLGSIRPGLPHYEDTGFLVWDPTQQLTPPGMSDPDEFAAAMAETVEAAGDTGCGYEGSLEAWYRFLVDPEPPAAVVVNGNLAEVQGVDQEVLAARAAFLRTDSVLGIVMLSDENDCSVLDDGYGWLVHRSATMYRGNTACQSDPNDACCQSCAESIANPGCPAIDTDPACTGPSGDLLDVNNYEDDLNLRCFEQKRRFGFDLLYPVQRYVDALTALRVPRRSDGQLVPNPIYASRDGVPPRSPEQVLLLGIVGVPWQDVADVASLSQPGLKLLSEDGPLPPERWDLILGRPEASPPVRPTDPFMIESPVDRTTLAGVSPVHPLLPNEALAPAGSTNPQANRINGHESVNVNNKDLQYACTFELPEPIVCDDARYNAGESCDCFDADRTFERTLCQPPPEGGPASTTQYYGKAYPGLRELNVLKQVGGHGIVASTCPKSADVSLPSYGYRPAMDALAGRVARQIGRSCLKTDAQAGPDGRTACTLVTASNDATCSCAADQGLRPVDASASGPVLELLEGVGYCGTAAACDSLCLCELEQLAGADLAACQTAAEPPDVPGFCYLNAVPGEVHAGDAELAADCVGAAPRRLRFSGGAPSGSIALLYCPE